jgi:hypothetical protein
MARTISVASQAKLDQNLGVEPALIIEIQWVDGGNVHKYSDKDLGNGEGKILDVSGLDNTVVIQGVQSGTSSDSQQIGVTLDDTDGTIKGIMDTHDVHKEPAWVYQWFQGLDESEKFLIFKGQISSPMQWNEGDRTVSFDIITRIEDAEVGFSMEEGNFDYVPEDLVGEPWPLVFGTVRTCPALKTRSARKGLLKTGFGIRDYMLGPKKEQANEACCPWRFVGFRSEYVGGGAYGSSSLAIKPVYEKEANCVCKRKAVICEMDLNIAKQAQFEYTTIDIVDGRFFPQGTLITLDISGARIYGSFNGTIQNPSDTFTIIDRTHPKLVEGDPLIPKQKRFGCDKLPNGNENEGNQTSIGTQTCILPDECDGWGTGLNYNNIVEDIGDSQEARAWNYLSTFVEAGFFWAEPGSEVRIAGDNELVYIANILPSTVHTVKAWRTFSVSNLRQLTTVPNSYYTVRMSDFGVYTTTEIVFDRPLSSRAEGWEDDIFVTQTSSIGPNPVDIMEWLITKYTSFTWDATFADIKTKVDNYPMNFMVPGRMNVFDLLKDMAFQGRMALVLRDDQFQLIYLAEEPIQNGTITEDDVMQNSLVLDHTNTEDLITKLVCEWRPQCHLEDPYTVILRYNGKKYGTSEQVFDFYTYNIQELVVKSATFWMIRMANTWRKIICKTPINKLALESLDGCYVTLPDIANGEIKCRVETATYNSADNSIDFVLQTPVRSGERDAFDFHYPAGISVEDLHPTLEDVQFGNAGGGGPGVDVEAPVGHVLGQPNQLASGFSFSQKSPCVTLVTDIYNDCRPDQGDTKPSDIDDIKPTVAIDEDNSIIPPSQSPINESTVADIEGTRRDLQQDGQNADQNGQITNNLNTGTGSTKGAGAGDGAGSGPNPDPSTDEQKEVLDELPTPDELDEQNKCHFDLTIFSLAPVDTVRISVGEVCSNPDVDPFICESGLGWCYCNEPGKSGCWVGNKVASLAETFSFGNIKTRDEMYESIEAMINGPGIVGQPHPAFQTTTDACGVGQEESTSNEIIGYKGTGSFDEDGNQESVVGKDGFMEDGWIPPAPCST